MAHWLLCVLTGRHAYSPWSENGAMFLRCTNCGRRSNGWRVSSTPASEARHAVERSRPRAPRVSQLSVVRSD